MGNALLITIVGTLIAGIILLVLNDLVKKYPIIALLLVLPIACYLVVHVSTPTPSEPIPIPSETTKQVPESTPQSPILTDTVLQGPVVMTTTPIPVPQIYNVIVNGSGKDLQITVIGKGFGNPPVHMPFTGNTAYFSFFNATKGWSAGYNGGSSAPTGVTLIYRAWTDTEIDIDGFAGEYNTNGWFNVDGDTVGISFLNYSSSGSIDYTWIMGNSPN